MPFLNQKCHFKNQNSQYRNQKSHLNLEKPLKEEKIFGNQKIIQEIKRYDFQNQNNTQEIKYPRKIDGLGISSKPK